VLQRPLGRATFVDGYGSVELGGGVAMRVFAPVPLPMSGRLLPMRGHRMRVVDDHGVDVPRGEVGELLVRGPGVMRGYHDADDATALALTEEGWLHTGDLARAHRFGLIELAGRKKDVIKHGGYSVFPAEVEQVLESHPSVAEAAVIGIADERKGAVPVAVVRLSGERSAEPEELVRFGREHLSDYKAPQRVVIVAELPRSGTDKVDKKALARLFDAT
jgi:acyl-CoA synthetase (AMP-forming)/AMP-acid ligase II